MSIENLKKVTGSTGSVNDLIKKFLEMKLGRKGDINSLTKEYMETMVGKKATVSDARALFNKKFGMDVFDDLLHFAQFDGVSSAIKLKEPVRLTGDFKVRCLFKTNTTPTRNQALWGDDSTSLVVYLNPNQNLQVQLPINSGSVYLHNLNFKLGEWNEATLARVDNSYILGLNGAETVLTHTDFLYDVSLVSVGDWLGGLTHKGAIADLEVWVDGNEYTGTKVVDLPMHEYKKDYNGDIFFYNKVASPDSRFSLKTLTSAHAYATYNPIVLDGDFLFEIDCLVQPMTQSASILFGNTEGPNGVVMLLHEGHFRLRDDSSIQVHSSTDYRLNTSVEQRVHLVVEKIDTTLTFTLNGRSVGSSSHTGVFTVNSVGRYSNGALSLLGQVFYAKIVNKGITEVEYNFDDNSKTLVNHAVPLGAELWDDDAATVEQSAQVKGNGVYRIVSNSGEASCVRLSADASVQNKDLYIEVDLLDGDINDIMAGETATESTSWEVVRDEFGQPTGRYKTLLGNFYDYIKIKRYHNDADATIANISVREATGYGVLEGVEGVDYEWVHDGYHAIGYNLTTEER